MIDQTISHYKILEKLGEGGMGVVYKAQDTKLNRTVALKFLPHGLQAHEPERARFLQEAQAAAGLNHPNICTIHDIASEGDQQFIVMEFVEGKTLTEITQSAIVNQKSALEYAIQIGEALQEAHSKGIVHRDIKTDNIMVNSKNQVKVMDFGLAKLKGSLKLTKTSSTVGTLAYMAPEQIEGGEVDARSDIFSFSVVLYQMLTGQMPFRGEHEAAMVYSIVNEEPTPIQKYLPDISSELVHVLNRALEKDPEDRYQTVRDMVIDLRRLKKQTSKVSQVIPLPESDTVFGQATVKATKTVVRRPIVRLAVAATGALVVVCVGILLVLFSHGPQLSPEMKFHTLQVPFQNVMYADVSQDGNWLVFPAGDDQGKADVYIMNVSQGQPRRVTYDSCSGIFNVSISPDASTILYTRRLQAGQALEVASVPFLGGKGRVVIERAEAVKWELGGVRIDYIVFSQVGSGRMTCEAWTANPDGSDRRLAFADTLEQRGITRMAADWSPDGKHLAWTRNYPGGYTEIVIIDVASGTVRQLTFDKKIADDPIWTRNNHIIFSSNRGGNVNLWVVPSSGGEPMQLTRGSGPDSPIWISSDCRRMIYSESQDLGHIKLGDLRNGSVRQLTVDERQRQTPSISPTGAFVAFAAKEEDEYSLRTDIYVMDRTGAEVRKLTNGPERKFYPFWSPDEKWITYGAYHPSEPPDSSRIYLINVDNPGQPKMIGKGFGAFWYDERRFVGWNGRRTYRGSIDSPNLIPFAEDSVWLCPVLASKYLCFNDYHAGREGLSITAAQSYESVGLKEARQLVRQGSLYPAFAQNFKEFYYTELTGKRFLHRVSLPDGKDERLAVAFPRLRSQFTVREDGKEIAYVDAYRKTKFVIIENLFK